MRTRILCSIGLCLLFCFVSPALSQAEYFGPSIPFETIDKGEISHYRYGDSSFAGADMLIKDSNSWVWFWKAHTKDIEPPPPLPYINFGKEMVIVTILGFQTSGGGPSIQVLRVDTYGRRLHVLIEDNETPGPLTVITNPFHIIKLRRLNMPSIVFEHQRP